MNVIEWLRHSWESLTIFLESRSAKRNGDKFMCVVIPPIAYESEVWHKMMARPDKVDLCRIFNFLPDHEQEGAGWWERVEVVKHVGFTTKDLELIKDPKCDWTLMTYLPQHIIRDLMDHKQVGFLRQEDGLVITHPVVWIRLTHKHQKGNSYDDV